MGIMKDKKKIKNKKKPLAYFKGAVHDCPMTMLERRLLAKPGQRVTRLGSVPRNSPKNEYQVAFVRTIQTALNEPTPFELKKRGDLLRLIKKQRA